jgi:hypothetical protein
LAFTSFSYDRYMDTLTAWDAYIGQYVTIPRAGYGLIAFAIFFLGVVACKLFRDRDLARFGETATGKVVRVSELDDVDHAIVHFVDSAGRPHEFQSDLPRRSGSIVIGTSVEVRYDPSKPERARHTGEPLRRAWLYIVYLIVAGGFGLVGFKFITAP